MLLIGVTNGLIIALIAIGYTLVYGILELINFAHADVFMLGTRLPYYRDRSSRGPRIAPVAEAGADPDPAGPADHHG